MLPRWTIGVLVRSIAFHAAIAVTFAVAMLTIPVLVLAPRATVVFAFHAVLHWYLWLQRKICGLGYDVRGRENLKPGVVLYASKHLSKWDSAMVPLLLGDPAVVLKKRLLKIPLYGCVILRMKHLVMPTQTTAASTQKLLRDAAVRKDEGRSILLFPEGTRTEVGSLKPGQYKRGVVALYKTLNVPCVPIALNSGVFWRRGSFLRYPGTVVMQILPPIPPGLGSAEFYDRLVRTLEDHSQRLVQEALVVEDALGAPQVRSMS